jgi:hypothetical protein
MSRKRSASAAEFSEETGGRQPSSDCESIGFLDTEDEFEPGQEIVPISPSDSHVSESIVAPSQEEEPEDGEHWLFLHPGNYPKTGRNAVQRSWYFSTINNPLGVVNGQPNLERNLNLVTDQFSEYFKLVNADGELLIKRFALQAEIGTKEHTAHVHLCINLSRSRRHGFVVELLKNCPVPVAVRESTGNPQLFSGVSGHVEIIGRTVKSNPRAAWEYCTKIKTRVAGTTRTYGEPPAANNPNATGTSADYLALKKSLDDGATEAEIATSHFNLFLRYHGAIQKYINLKQPVWTKEHVDAGRTCVWLYGNSGHGKSKYCYETYGDSAYYVTITKELWFTGYNPKKHTVLVFDDFRRDQIKWARLLELTDRYPNQLRVHGGMLPNMATTLVFTCIWSPRKTFSGESEAVFQILRRINKTLHFAEAGQPPVEVDHMVVDAPEPSKFNVPESKEDDEWN